eukprot:20723-Heterococcus_DN1.PRE.1
MQRLVQLDKASFTTKSRIHRIASSSTKLASLDCCGTEQSPISTYMQWQHLVLHSRHRDMPWCGGRSVAMPIGIKASDSSILTKQVGVVGYGDHWMKIGHNRGADFTDALTYGGCNLIELNPFMTEDIIDDAAIEEFTLSHCWQMDVIDELAAAQRIQRLEVLTIEVPDIPVVALDGSADDDATSSYNEYRSKLKACMTEMMSKFMQKEMALET